MTTRTRKFLKVTNQCLYVLSIAMLISGMMLSLAVKPVAAATGTVWTTDATCTTQDQMQYQEGEPIYFNYSGIANGVYTWQIAPTNDAANPIATGSFTVAGDPTSCIYAYTFALGTAATYKLTILDPVGDKVKSDNLKIVPAPVPNITLDKQVVSVGPYDSVGDAIAYNFVVSNPGQVNLTGVIVTDSGTNSAPVCPATTLAIGASMTCTGLHSVSQADLDAGSFTNTASADSDQVGPVTDTATVTMAQSRSLSVDKTKTGPLSGTFAVGAVFNYTITVTNTGNVTLTGVTVSDSAATLGTCAPVQPATLAPQASIVCPASHTVTQADIDAGTYPNTATGSSGALSGTDSVTVTLLQSPALTIDKSVVTLPPYVAGGTITYSIVVTNTGNVTLHNVTVSDPGTVVGACSPASGSSLAPLATMTCPATHVVTQAQFDAGSYTNTAVADSNETSPQSDSATVNFVAGPALGIEKTITSSGPYILASTINFSIVVTNTGNVTLGTVTVTDPNAVLGTCVPANGSSLAPLGTMTCGASHVVTQPDIDAGSYMNTATAVSTNPSAGPVSDSVGVDFTPQPGLSITKDADPGSYILGSTIPYTIIATNTGNVTLHNVMVNDPSAVIDSCSPVLGSSLAPAATMECSASHIVQQADMDAGSYVNTSTANSTEVGPVTATETVNFVQLPNLSIVKSVTSEPLVNPAIGNVLTYSILLTNTGNITLHNVTIADLNADLGTCIPAVPAASLAIGGTILCSASHTITQADLDAGLYMNTAVGDSNETDPKEDSETVLLVQGPALSFEKKEVSQGPYVLGATISYAFELTNIGNVTLHNVTITDPKAVTDSCTPALPVAELAPLAKVTCAASHVVTAADIAAGLTFVNTAVGDSNETNPVSDTVTVTLGIKGCTDPAAENYNSAATINDGSCTYPNEPTPTVVPTLPIPATGGQVLIPVTGADLSNTYAGGKLPRGLFLGGMSAFGFAMVLSGLRRKMHL